MAQESQMPPNTSVSPSAGVDGLKKVFRSHQVLKLSFRAISSLRADIGIGDAARFEQRRLNAAGHDGGHGHLPMRPSAAPPAAPRRDHLPAIIEREAGRTRTDVRPRQPKSPTGRAAPDMGDGPGAKDSRSILVEG